MTKTALVILSEIVQALEGVREVAYDLQKKGESREPIVRSDVKIEAEELSEQSVHEIEAARGAEELDVSGALLSGCREIEDKAVEMIKLCLEFISPL